MPPKTRASLTSSSAPEKLEKLRVTPGVSSEVTENSLPSPKKAANMAEDAPLAVE